MIKIAVRDKNSIKLQQIVKGNKILPAPHLEIGIKEKSFPSAFNGK